MKKVFIFAILVLLFISSVYAANSEPPSFFDQNLWDTFFNVESFWDFSIDYNSHSSMNWYPLADWERNFCQKELTSDYIYDDKPKSQQMIEVDGKVYDVTVALNAEMQDTYYYDEDEEPFYLLTVGWYIQGLPVNNPTDNTVEYKILLKPGNDYINLGGGDTEKNFTISTGTTGFYSNYTTTNYTNAQLIIDSNNIYDFEIVRVGVSG